jgi:transcriptional regulator with XRE-family HTH domain
MAHAGYLKDRARSLRQERQMTIDEIADQLALSRTTIYSWVRDLPLARESNWSRGQRLGTLAMQAKYRSLREEAYAAGAAEYEHLSELPTFRDFVALYIAEGYKRNRNVLSFANSDSRMVALATGWLGRLNDKPSRFWLQYHADQDPERLRAYWAELLQIDGSDIGIQRKSNSGQLTGRRWRSRHGVLTIVVNDTLLRARMQAWIDSLREDWKLDSASPSGV